MTAHWGIPDPAAVKGTPEQVAKAFRDAFFMLERRITLFLSLPFSGLNSLALKEELVKICQTDATPAGETPAHTGGEQR